MHQYIEIGSIRLPSYGLMIMIGIIVANIVAYKVIKKEDIDMDDFITLEGYCMLGGFLGAKILYLLISYKDIDASRLTDIHYLIDIIRTGYVFYGGLIGGILAVLLAGKIHHIDVKKYIGTFIFVIPLVHCFGRIGCFLAGCCYGIPYDGIGAVIYPAGSIAPSGISLFPVQLVEAACLLLISIIIIIYQHHYGIKHTFALYLIMYGIVRFILEFYRYDEIRGRLYGLSTSQWICICAVAIGLILLIKDKISAVKSRSSV